MIFSNSLNTWTSCIFIILGVKKDVWMCLMINTSMCTSCKIKKIWNFWHFNIKLNMTCYKYMFFSIPRRLGSCTDSRFWFNDQINIEIDENHRKTKFMMILMKFGSWNMCLKSKKSHNFTILDNFWSFWNYFWSFCIVFWWNSDKNLLKRMKIIKKQ